MHYSFLIPLFVQSALEQTAFTLLRVTISYQAIALDLSAVWLGAVTATYALLPLFIALRAGRYVDRGHDARLGWIGGGLLVVASAGFVISQSLVSLFVWSAVLGVSQIFIAIGIQSLVARRAPPGAMNSWVGNYLTAGVVGQCLGPYIVGWAGGSASIPPTYFLFVVGLCISIVTFASLLMLRPPPTSTARPVVSSPLSLSDIVRLPGMGVVFLVSIATVTSQDLIVIYLPLLGAERGMGVSEVGTLLVIRSMASMASRFMFLRLINRFGAPRLMAITTFVSAAGYFGMALPLPMVVLCVVVAVAGAALGLSMSLAISRALSIPAPHARGTANSLRMMGNRVGQIVVPSLAGLIAAATGVGGTFLVIGASLAGVWAVVRFSGRQAGKGETP